MKLLDLIKNKFLYSDKYKTHSEAIIIACYFNPQNSPYRLKAFNIFYDSIKHLNHQIIECVIGDSQPQLPENKNIKRIHTENLLWHKESLLNKLVSELPLKFKYIFWVDADVIFTSNDWLIDSVESLQTNNIVQPFEYCVHLDRDELEPSFNTRAWEHTMGLPTRHPKMWRSFCATFVTTHYGDNENYDRHGHVGFAWGARREVLDAVPLYDKALIGGADHIIAHAAAGHICHSCISKSFTDNLDDVNDWSKRFYRVVNGKIGYASGTLYHIWHGDIEKRQYLKRIQDFTPKTKQITKKDKNGLYVTDNGNDDQYVRDYFNHREVKNSDNIISITKSKPTKGSTIPISKSYKYNQKRIELQHQYPDRDDSFIESMLVAYATDSTMVGTAIGGNLLGAMIGDALNTNDDVKDNVEFGGGSFGGAGSGGDWTEDNNNVSENFS